MNKEQRRGQNRFEQGADYDVSSYMAYGANPGSLGAPDLNSGPPYSHYRKKRHIFLKLFVSLLVVLVITSTGAIIADKVAGISTPVSMFLFKAGTQLSGQKSKRVAISVTAGVDELGIYQKVAAENEDISFDEDEGLAYYNDQLLVFANSSAKKKDIKKVAQTHSATITDYDKDIDMYTIELPETDSLDELDDLADEISENDSVDDAYVIPVCIIEDDTYSESTSGIDDSATTGIGGTDSAGAAVTTGDSSFSDETSDGVSDEGTTDYGIEVPERIYPDDPWAPGDVWNVAVPSGGNWGDEAIDAPQAWGYLNQLTDVCIGDISAIPYILQKDLKDTDSVLYKVAPDGSLTNFSPEETEASDASTHDAGIMVAGWDNAEGISGIAANKADFLYCIPEEEIPSDSDTANNYRVVDATYYIRTINALVQSGACTINVDQNTGTVRGFAASQGNENAINALQRLADITEAGLKKTINESSEKFVICVSAGISNDTYFEEDPSSPYGYKEIGSQDETYMLQASTNSDDSLAIYNNFLALIDDPDVKEHIIVVGSVGIDTSRSNSSQTNYRYSDFSCVGDRVDIVAPGEDIYSTICPSSGEYGYLSGTAMATAHVSATAALIFAGNPELSGFQVKTILLNSASGRFYFGDDGNNYAGMVDAGEAVYQSLATKKTSVSRVTMKNVTSGIDLCFVVDTTNSMQDDIDNAKENMRSILETLKEKSSRYRVALVDYRDFASRTGYDGDYASRLELDFTTDDTAIINAINALDLGYGGDNEETVYSGIATALGLDWRSDSKHVIIILGDAAPLDPEPYTGYTYSDVLAALQDAETSVGASAEVGFEESAYRTDATFHVAAVDESSTGSGEDSLTTVYTINTSGDIDTEEMFSSLAGDTGGVYSEAESSEVSEAISDSIDAIETIETVDVDISFGDAYAGEPVDVYDDSDDFLFTFDLDEEGAFTVRELDPDKYLWKLDRLGKEGSFTIDEETYASSIQSYKDAFYTPIALIWYHHRVILIASITCVISTSILIIALKYQKKQRMRY